MEARFKLGIEKGKDEVNPSKFIKYSTRSNIQYELPEQVHEQYELRTYECSKESSTIYQRNIIVRIEI